MRKLTSLEVNFCKKICNFVMYFSNYKQKCLMSDFSVTLSHDEFASDLTKLYATDGQFFVPQYLASSLIISEKWRTMRVFQLYSCKPSCNQFPNFYFSSDACISP